MSFSNLFKQLLIKISMIAYLQFIHIFQIQEHNSPPRAAQVAVECVKVLDDLLFPGWFF